MLETWKDWGWSLMSTKEMCEGIQNILEKELNIKPKLKYSSNTNNNTYQITKGGNESILKILDYLYENSEEYIRLDRKFELYKELKEQQNNRQFVKEGKRETYRISKEDKEKIIIDIENGVDFEIIAKQYGRWVGSIKRIAEKLKKEKEKEKQE